MKKTLLISVCIYFILTALSSCKQYKSKSQKTDDYKLVWEDEFSKNKIPDSLKWEYDTIGNEAGWGNNEAQVYTAFDPENAFVSDGNLNIRALNEKINNKDFSSARLISKVAWKFAKIEVRAKLPAGRGTWSAIWMMPENWRFPHGNWPDVGEIDIMEHVGHDAGTIHASAHSKNYQWQKGTQKTATIFVPDATQEFHNYTFEWDEDEMRTAVDDSVYFVYRNQGLGPDSWPYNKSFYLILNLAVGGAWGSLQGIDTSAFPQIMQIDYVKVYQKINQNK